MTEFRVTTKRQQGAALIAVMLFLIVIAAVGIFAVKRSSTDLKVATADQMNTVLLQSSESANQKLESIVNGLATSTQYKQVVESPAGALGYFLQNPIDNAGDEFVYCFDTTANSYLRNHATIFRGSGMLENNNGSCKTSSGYTYTSRRNVVATQVNIHLPRKTTTSDSETYRAAHFTDGSSADGVGITRTHDFDVYTTSILPAYGSPGDCLRKRAGEVDFNDSIAGCLANSDTPHNAIYQEVRVTKESMLNPIPDPSVASGTITSNQ